MIGVIRHLAINHRNAIVTTNSSQKVNAFLGKHDLDNLIHAVYGVDSPGSKVQKIVMARKQLLENREQGAVFMVGDSLSDILAAKEASVTSIAVTWGHQSLENLLGGNPDYVVRSAQDLMGVIEQKKALLHLLGIESRLDRPGGKELITHLDLAAISVL
ncbi:MAG: HAD family hydrolase [Bacteroidota bacterium]